jgi:hypothetical protein
VFIEEVLASRPTGAVREIEKQDAIHAHCLANDIEVTFPLKDEPWGVRESMRAASTVTSFGSVRPRGRKESESAPGGP